MSMPDLLAGVYQHYKGPLYLVLGYGRDANRDNRSVVVYIGLELTPSATPGARLTVRDVADFYAIVDPTTGDAVDIAEPTEANPRRFAYVGATWNGLLDLALPTGVGEAIASKSLVS